MPELHGLKLRLGPRRWPDPWMDVPVQEPALAPAIPGERATPQQKKGRQPVRGLDSGDGPGGPAVITDLSRGPPEDPTSHSWRGRRLGSPAQQQ